jgi:hypothetical protein
MAQQSQPDSSNSFPGIGSLAGLLFTGAIFGIGVFGAAVAVFDTIRDKTELVSRTCHSGNGMLSGSFVDNSSWLLSFCPPDNCYCRASGSINSSTCT